MPAIWVLSRVGLWVGKRKSSRIIMCLHFRCRNGTSPRSTLHHLSFARLLDSLQSPPRSLIIQKSPVRSITALVVSSACLPRPLHGLAGREKPSLSPPPPPFPQLPMPYPLHMPPWLSSWAFLFCSLAGQFQRPKCRISNKHSTLFSGAFATQSQNVRGTRLCLMCSCF